MWFRAVQRSALCRSRRELSNAYFIAKFGFGTAENEPCQVWPIESPLREGVGRQVPGTGNVGRAAGPFEGSREGRSSRVPAICLFLCDDSGSRARVIDWQICKCFTNFWRTRSRLYQNEILQENMRLTAFFKLYKMCILLHRCNLKIFAKSRFEKSAIFVRNS